MEEHVKSLVDNYTDVFEGQVMINLLQNFEFYDKFKSTICLSGGKFHSDFGNPADNVIYRAISMCRQTMINSNRDQIQRQDIMAMLAVLHSRNDISETEFQIAVPRLEELMTGAAMSPEMLAPAVAHWLISSRGRKHVARAAAGQVDYNQLLVSMQEEKETLHTNLEEKTSFGFREAMKSSEEEDRPRYRTGLSAVDSMIGGGLARKEFTLFVQPSGAGKTVTACQLAHALSGQGLYGILITTEQPPLELIPRFVSANCEIPFSLIKDGIKREKLRAEQCERMDRLVDHLESYMLFEDWTKSNHDASLEIPSLIRKAKKKFKKLDWIILDWIGGSLGANVKNQLDQFRMVMKLAGDSLATHASNEDIITVGFAQATTALAKNKRKVDRTMIGECKSLGDRATNIIGGSALQAGESEEDSDKATYLEKQFFFIDKARKGTGGVAPVRRDFAYQRFVDWGVGRK